MYYRAILAEHVLKLLYQGPFYPTRFPPAQNIRQTPLSKHY